MCLAALTAQGSWSWGMQTSSCARERQTLAGKTPASGLSSVCTSLSPMAGSSLCRQHQTPSNAVSISWDLILLCLCNNECLVPLLQDDAVEKPQCAQIDSKCSAFRARWVCATIWVTCSSYLYELTFLKQALVAGGSSWCLEFVRTTRDFGALQFVLLASRSFLGAGSQCECAYRGIYAFPLFVYEHASSLPSWEGIHFEWRHNQNLLSTSWQVAEGFEFKPGPDPSTVASPACQRSDLWCELWQECNWNGGTGLM